MYQHTPKYWTTGDKMATRSAAVATWAAYQGSGLTHRFAKLPTTNFSYLRKGIAADGIPVTLLVSTDMRITVTSIQKTGMKIAVPPHGDFFSSSPHSLTSFRKQVPVLFVIVLENGEPIILEDMPQCEEFHFKSEPSELFTALEVMSQLDLAQ